MNLNGEIDWIDTDRIVSNDTRYVSLDGDWWRESSTWLTRQNGSPALTRVGFTRTRLTGLGRARTPAAPQEEFVPQYDFDGDQTLIKTATGIWSVTYNGENRPIRWELVTANSNTSNSNTQTLLQMSYDRMGRRVTKNDQCFVYDGYLQICNFHFTATAPDYNYFTWDPTESVATRPLMWKRGDAAAYYTHDGNKNVSEVIASDDTLAAHYEYAPFGALTVSRGASAAVNPWRRSSEFDDVEIGCEYYNYREFESAGGRWMSREPFGENLYSLSLYSFCANDGNAIDYLGLVRFSDLDCKCIKGQCKSDIEKIRTTLNDYLKKMEKDPLGYYRKASDVFRAPLKQDKELIKNSLNNWPTGWRTVNEYKAKIKKLLDDLNDGKGPSVICCPSPNEPILKQECKNTAAGYLREGPEALKGRIIMCPEGLLHFKNYGGCGCLILHELLHKFGFKADKLPYLSPDREKDPRKWTEEYRKIYIHNRDIENGMVRLARHLLKMNKEFRCNGYDIWGQSDDDQLLGSSEEHLW